MLSSNLSLNNAAAASKTFVLISQDGTGTVRVDNSTTASQPRKLTIRHTASGKGASAVDRHLLQFSTEKLDAAGNTHVATVNLTMAIPRASAITQTDIDDLVAFVKNFLAVGANVTSLQLGES